MEALIKTDLKLGNQRIVMTDFRAMGWPCVRECIRTGGDHGVRVRVHYYLRTELLPPMRGEALRYLKRSTTSLGALLDHLEGFPQVVAKVALGSLPRGEGAEEIGW